MSVGQIVADSDFDSFSAGGQVETIRSIHELAAETKQSVLKYIDAMKFLVDNDKNQIKEQVQKIPNS